jgi:antitoxin component YwqK of YwqJK toxin-antitoxin module
MRIHSLRFLLAFIFSILFQASFGQRSTEVQTDSSIIETRTYPEFNSIGIFNELKDKSKTYYTELYYDTKKLKEQGVFVGGSAVGKWKEFFQDGKLKR